MSRRVVCVLVCTFVALAAATALVPTHDVGRWIFDAISGRGPRGGPFAYVEWRWLWEFPLASDDDHPVAWLLYATQVGTVAALGGLLALILHTRHARRAAGRFGSDRAGANGPAGRADDV